jgi:hypothetical protein
MSSGKKKMAVWLLDAIKNVCLKQTPILDLRSQFVELRQYMPGHFLAHTE